MVLCKEIKLKKLKAHVSSNLRFYISVLHTGYS